MDVEKFRPNVVVSGAYDAYQEDYWGKLVVNGSTEIVLPHNCVRCKSINIDYATGKPGEGPSGEVLKRLQKDRRVDVGAKWSPVFGRYGFWGRNNGGKGEEVWRVGDRVNVAKVNEGLTVWSKFCHGEGINFDDVGTNWVQAGRVLGSHVEDDSLHVDQRRQYGQGSSPN
jgi:uncharacterized protein YcbX